MRLSQQPRGSALLIAVIALAVLLILVLGAIRFTGTNRVGAGSKLSSDRVAACAEVARRTLLSRLQLFGAPVKKLTLDGEKILDDPDPSKQSTIATGHYDSAPMETVVEITGMTGGNNVRGLSNVMSRTGGMGGQYFRTVVKCREAPPSQREAEIEFIFRYGI